MSKKTFNDNNHITNYVKKVGMSKIYKIMVTYFGSTVKSQLESL